MHHFTLRRPSSTAEFTRPFLMRGPQPQERAGVLPIRREIVDLVGGGDRIVEFFAWLGLKEEL